MASESGIEIDFGIGKVRVGKDALGPLGTILDRIFRRWQGANVIFFGAAGGGKTSVIREYLGVELAASETQKLTKVRAELDEDEVLVIDTPGDEIFFGAVKKALDELNSGRKICLIHVVDLGYNVPYELLDQDRLERFARDFGCHPIADGEANLEYLNLKRDQEFNYFKRVFVDEIFNYDAIAGLITVVNKRDLWGVKYDATDAVAHYGSESVYGEVISQYLPLNKYHVVSAMVRDELFFGKKVDREMLSQDERDRMAAEFLVKLTTLLPQS